MARAIPVAVVCAFLGATPSPASACGCFSPPVPDPVSGDEFAVNQEAEQIIFEVPGDGTVVAHVLIRYQGKPASFAWIVPVPSVPALSLSETHAFTILENQTGPRPSSEVRDVCPQAAFRCERHSSCPRPPVCDGVDAGFGGFSDAGFPATDASAMMGGEPVEVINRETIGAYDTITFSAGDTAAAITWLQDEGFIVNDTMGPYMQPYADAGMLFVASRLVPGSGVDQIRPLRMEFAADRPMIPLRLTAVATEPHLTVTAYIYADDDFEALGHPRVTVPTEALSTDAAGRINYPQVLARVIDEAGGDAFTVEYEGASPLADLALGGSFCCNSGFDNCGIGGDGVCQCPAEDFDAMDCPDMEAILAGATLIDDLASRYERLTRLTTRLSADEMTFDPEFGPRATREEVRRLEPVATRWQLGRCEADVIDRPAYDAVLARDLCTSIYCGPGTCVAAGVRGGCVCDAGFVARRFTDLDGESSVTCVPETPPVDLEAGGLDLPDACASVSCGAGSCVDLAGVPSCRCDAGNAAFVLGGSEAPSCAMAGTSAEGPGADAYTSPIQTLEVCAPPPPGSCGAGGWLVPRSSTGTLCESSMPDPARLVVPPPPECPTDVCRDATGRVVPIAEAPPTGMADCGCRVGAGGMSSAAMIVFALLGLGVFFRRRR